MMLVDFLEKNQVGQTKAPRVRKKHSMVLFRECIIQCVITAPSQHQHLVKDNKY